MITCLHISNAYFLSRMCELIKQAQIFYAAILNKLCV